MGGVGLALVWILAALGCSRAEPPPPPEPDFHAVLLMASGTPLPVQEALKAGLREVKSDLFAATSVRSVECGQPMIEMLRRTGREAPDLVFCHVPGEEHVVVEEAAAYPDTQFVTIPGRTTGPNVAGVVFRVDGAAYVAGATLAAAAGGRPLLVVEAPDERGFRGLAAGFGAGAASVGAAAPVAVTKERALEDIDSGRAGGVLYTGFVVPEPLLTACATAGIPLVDTGLGLKEEGQPGVFGTVIVRMGEAVRRLARERWAGTLEGSIYTFSLGSGVVDFGLESPAAAPEAVLRAMGSARSDVLAGIAEIEDLGM